MIVLELNFTVCLDLKIVYQFFNYTAVNFDWTAKITVLLKKVVLWLEIAHQTTDDYSFKFFSEYKSVDKFKCEDFVYST